MIDRRMGAQEALRWGIANDVVPIKNLMDTHVTAGNVHDSQPYIHRLQRQISRFSLNTVATGDDAGYFTTSVCHLVKEMSIALVSGYRSPNKGQNAYQKNIFAMMLNVMCICVQLKRF